MNDIYKSPEYRRSRVAYHIQCVTEYLAGLLVADAFLVSLLGSRILAAVQANGNMMFGIPMHGQQLLAGMSLCVILTAIVFNKCVVEKQAVMKQ